MNKKRFTRFLVSLGAAIVLVGGLLVLKPLLNLPGGQSVFAASSAITDEKLLSVLQILANYQEEEGKNFYTEYVGNPYVADITTMTEAAPYNKPASQDVLENYTGPLYLTPYPGINPQGLNSAVKVTEVYLPAGTTAIGANQFYGMSLLTKVVMPKTVTEIGDSAFARCYGLKSISIYETDPTSLLTESTNLADLRFVSTIGNSSFSSCSSLEHIKLFEGDDPSKKTMTIKSNAFTTCSNLLEAKLPKMTATTLGTGVFSGCSNLQRMDFEDSLEIIPKNTLTDAGTKQFFTVHFPANLKKIDAYALQGAYVSASNLSECTKLEEIAEYAFKDGALISGSERVIDLSNTSLKRISYSAFHCFNNANILAPNPKVILPDSIDQMGAGVFAFSDITEINIPGSLTAIPDGLFLGCYYLTALNIPDGCPVTSIGAHAFELCGSLPNTDFLSGMGQLESIGDYAFAKCIPTKLDYKNNPDGNWFRTATIPETVTSIGASAFENDFLLGSLHLSSKIETIPNRLMICENATSPTWTDYTVTDPLTEEPVSYKFKSDATYTTLKNQYNSYSTNNFRVLSCLTEVVMGNNVASIGEQAFFGNSHLEILDPGTGEKDAIRLPQYLESIGKEAFARCSAYTGKVSSGTFAMTGIKKVFMEDSVTSLGTSAFAYDYSLDEVQLSTGLIVIPTSCFQECGYTESGEVFGLKTISEIDNIETISENAFLKCYNLDSMRFSDSVVRDFQFGRNNETIGKAAFQYTPLKSAETLSRTKLKTIGSYAFGNCSNLTRVTCPNTLESIGDRAFQTCPALTKIEFPVKASLNAGMLYGDTQVNLQLTPILGDITGYGGSQFRVPLNKDLSKPVSVPLPANAFARGYSQIITYVGEDGQEHEFDPDHPEYFTVSFNKDHFDITGLDQEVDNVALRFSAEVSFTNCPSKTMSIEYPIAVVQISADPSTMEYEPENFKFGSSAAGVTLDYDATGTPILYLNRKQIGKVLTLAGHAEAADENKDFSGMVTDPAKWTVVSGTSLKYVEDSVTKTMVAQPNCKTTAGFLIDAGTTTTVVRFAFDDGSANPPHKDMKVVLIDAISAINYTIASIGDTHQNPTAINMWPGQADKINAAAVYPDGNKTADELIFRSNNPEIVSVDQNGNIKAGNTKGKATITIDTFTHSISKSITVNVAEKKEDDPGAVLNPVFVDIHTDSLYTDGKTAYVYVDKTAEFSADCLPSYATQGVTWTVSGTGIVSLETVPVEGGNDKARLTGKIPEKSVTLTATAQNGTAKGTITVKVIAEADSLVFMEPEPTMEAGTTKSFSLSSDPKKTSGIFRTPATSAEPVTFTSSDPSVLHLGTTSKACDQQAITIDNKTGTVYYKGIKEGTAKIVATTKTGAFDELNVTVVSAPITKLTCINKELTLLPGTSAVMRLTKEPANSTEKILFESADPKIATVNSAGKITAVAPGKVTIKARSTVKKASATCTVTVPKVGDTVKVGNYTFTVGKKNVLILSSIANLGTKATVPATAKISGNTYKVTGITASLFAGKTGLKTVVFKAAVASIPAGAFNGCTGLKNLVMSPSTKVIGNGAFTGCTGLKGFTVGAGVTTIGKKAFWNCSKLKTMVFQTKVLKAVGKGAVKTVKKGATFKCPKGKAKKYGKLLKKSGLPKGAKVK